MVNNVLTLAQRAGRSWPTPAPAYADLGFDRSRGTQVFQLAGNIARGGIVETAFGITLGELVDGYGGGTRSRAGRSARSRSAARSAPTSRSTSSTCAMDYEAFAAAGAMVGHGGIVVFDDTVDMAAAGAVRDGVLRRGVVRQVHAVPHRRHPRRRADRQDHRRRATATPTSCCSTTCAR